MPVRPNPACLLVLPFLVAGCASPAPVPADPPSDPPVAMRPEGTPPAPAPPPAAVAFRPLFDGATLNGWTKVGGGATYAVEDGHIVGRVGPGRNTFLRTDATFADFVLQLDVRLDVPGNSGIQFRSHQRAEDGVVYGYQCEIDPSDRSWSGGVYDESRRGWLASLEGPDKAAARAAFKIDAWNTYEIRAFGNTIETFVNGVQCTSFQDDADAEGFIALQVHSGSQGVIRWRNIQILEFE